MSDILITFAFGALAYVLGAFVLTSLLAIAIAWGLKWGIKWGLKEIARDSELEAWLKRVLGPSENQINNSILESTTENRNESN